MIGQASSTSGAELFWMGLALLVSGPVSIWVGRRGWRGQYGEPWVSLGEPYKTFWGSWFLAIPVAPILIYGGLGLLLIAFTGNDTGGTAGWIWGITWFIPFAIWFLVVLVYLFLGFPDRWLPPHQRRAERERGWPRDEDQRR